ncbi:MAG: 2-nitropropane dioxygenase [Nitrospirae bacterium]|nr:2-nitropropane dioxygenase [Nitrospirota bacterium]MBI3352504.1 2-nitropropane dioxygenase [Nitrospirota bacterium]
MTENKFEIQCPCCQARLIIDGASGTVLWHEARKSEKTLPTMSDMIRNLDLQKKAVEEKIQNESKALKDRSRILEEKFKESMKRLDKNEDLKPVRPIDLD